MKVRMPSGVGTRPAEAWALSISPASWSSARVLRMLAGESDVGMRSESAADATGPALVSTCNSLLDTKIAAYPGSTCPTTGTSLACNDDTCALQSEITFPVVAGTSYMLQIGNFPGATGGTGHGLSVVGVLDQALQIDAVGRPRSSR